MVIRKSFVAATISLVQVLVTFYAFGWVWFLKSEVLWLQYWAQRGSWKMPDGTKLFWFLIHKEPGCQSCWAPSSSHWNLWPQANAARSAWFNSLGWHCCRTCPTPQLSFGSTEGHDSVNKLRTCKEALGKARNWCPTVPSLLFLLKPFFFFFHFIQVLNVFSVKHSSTLLALFWFSRSWQETDLEIEIWILGLSLKSCLLSLFSALYHILMEEKNPWDHSYLCYTEGHGYNLFLKMRLGSTHELYSGDCFIFWFGLGCFSASSSFYSEVHQNSNQNTWN